MPSLRKSFGLRLRFIRRARDMSQERFAEIVGISVDFLSLMERGINSPSFDTLEQISKKIGVSVMDLFDFSQSRPPNQPSTVGKKARSRAARTAKSHASRP